jgi:hypothetical protein
LPSARSPRRRGRAAPPDAEALSAGRPQRILRDRALHAGRQRMPCGRHLQCLPLQLDGRVPFRCTMDVGDRERLLISSQLRTNHTTMPSPACARRCALFPRDAVARPRVTLKVLSCSHVDGRTQAPHAMRRPARQRARRLRGVRAASAAKLRTRQCRGHAAALAAYLGPISGRAPATGLRRRYLDEMGLMVNGTLLREAAGKTGSSGSSASGGRGNVAGNARRRTAEARTGPGPAP